ncbi:MAG: hypothetical protein K0U93_30000 [Gammaproteobacteria bacterium]|nr:hypothetical protein [Gammaproteobacteria bacterium]
MFLRYLRPMLMSLLALAMSFSVHAMPIFVDTFDAEVGSGDGQSGLSGKDYTAFAQWSVGFGTVDLVAQGDFGPIDCAQLSGKCVDLDGSTANAGVLTSIAIALLPGRYTLSYKLAGVASTFGSAAAMAPNVVNVSVGALANDSHQLAFGDPFQLFTNTFDVAVPLSVSIAFADQGNDNFGAILDDVSLVAAPSAVSVANSASLLLMGLACLGVRGLRARMRTTRA